MKYILEIGDERSELDSKDLVFIMKGLMEIDALSLEELKALIGGHIPSEIEKELIKYEAERPVCARCEAIRHGHEPKNCKIFESRGECKFIKTEQTKETGKVQEIW
jgi:hypothetical protein